MQRILLIQPSKHWNMNSANVFLSTEEGDLLMPKGRLTTEALTEDDDKTRFLLRVCDSLDESKLYEEFGKRFFRTQQLFWDKVEDKIKSHIQRVVGIRLKDAINRAQQLGITIYYREKLSDNIYLNKQLGYADEELKPIMNFKKESNDIIYVLALHLNDSEIVPCSNKITILSYAPSLLILNNTLYSLPEDTNAKILLPFLKKKSISIPIRMCNEYMKTFILRNASKAEIIVDGLNVTDIKAEPKCLLSLSNAFNGKAVISLSYKYDKVVFQNGDKRMAAVSIRENGNEIQLVRTKRDFAYEEGLLTRLLTIDKDWPQTNLHTPVSERLFNSMAEAVMWISTNESNIQKWGLGEYELKQHTKTPYYLHRYTIRQSKTWIGDWLNIRIALILNDGTKIPFAYFRDAIIRGQEETELPDGSIFFIPKEWFETYGGLMMLALANGDFLKIHRSQLNAINHQLYNIEEDKDTVLVLQENEQPPKGLHATLRTYQEEGLKWLKKNMDANTGCCLADDMGLGKTIQTIALIIHYKETHKNCNSDNRTPQAKTDSSGMVDMFADFFNSTTNEAKTPEEHKPSLIVCPSSLVYNWYNEFQRFAPGILVCQYTGNINERKRKFDTLGRWDVIITTYRTATNDIDDLSVINFGITVFDESQLFKNRTSQLYAAMLRIKSDQRIALSGTPMENSLPELWSLMNVLNPLLLGDYKTFQKNFASPINENLEDIRTDILRNTIAPYFLRRTKEQVLTDLPERQDEIVMCNMTDEQKHIYEEEMSKARNLVASGKHDEFSVLAAIGRLRQIANHPSLTDATRQSDGTEQSYAKAKETTAISENSIMELSGKTTAIFERLEALQGTNHKVLLFSEYVSFLNLIGKEMNSRNWKYEMLTGESQNREKIISHFTNDKDCQFFLVSLKAGGVGLNLTCADYVFLLNPWWNKAAEEQAIGRAHRIGQRRSVFVYRFVTEESLEEKIIKLQDYKQSMIDAVMPFLK